MSLLRTPLARLVGKATGFTLSPCQRALLAIGSGQRVQDLTGEEKEAATRALGYDHGPDRRLVELFINAGARGGKTLLSAYLAAHRALVIDLSDVAPGEVVRVAFISASKRQARAGLRYARGFIDKLGLTKLVESDRLDSFTIRRNGHTIEFAVMRGNTGGDALAGSWYAAVVVHECAIATDPSSGAVALDLDAVEKSVRPRLRPPRGPHPGGLIILESTSRDAVGAAYERSQQHGDPTASVAVFKASTLELRPDDAELAEHIEAERAGDPINAAREFDTHWLTAGSGFVFDDVTLDACTDSGGPTNLEPEPTWQSWAAVDLAFANDGSAVAIVRKTPSGCFELCALKRWKPRKGQPLRPSVIIGEALDVMERHGTRQLWTDAHHIDQVRELALDRRIHVRQLPGGSQGKHATHRDAQELLGSGTFTMGADGHLRRSLLRITANREPSGAVKIRSPRKAGDHGDDASALVGVLHAAYRYGGGKRDPLPRAGRPSPGLQQLGLVGGDGRPRYEGAFEVNGSQTAVRRVRRVRRGNFGGDSFGSGGF